MGVGLERVLVVNWEAWPGLGVGESGTRCREEEGSELGLGAREDG